MQLALQVAAVNNPVCFLHLHRLNKKLYEYLHEPVRYLHICKKFTVLSIDIINCHIYKLFDKRHRDNDLPAIIYPSGGKEWYQYGKCHRDEDKPAVIYADGIKLWYKNGERHRDGNKPAVIDADGTKEWWQLGERHRDGDKPAIIRDKGPKEWYQHGKQYIPSYHN